MWKISVIFQYLSANKIPTNKIFYGGETELRFILEKKSEILLVLKKPQIAKEELKINFPLTPIACARFSVRFNFFQNVYINLE